MSDPGPEWFVESGGLRFACTMCGNCCSGPEGYVLVTDQEITLLAKRLSLEEEHFRGRYTHMTSEGRSLIEIDAESNGASKAGRDCVFLDRQTIPGRAICSVYETRPRQCRTWPFWPSVIGSRSMWERAKRTCPGMDHGPMHSVQQIRVQRDALKI